MRVFVYGTLLTGCPNHGVLGGLKPITSDARVFGKLYHLGGFPGATALGLHNTMIKGEVYYVDQQTLEALDRLEGYRGPDNFKSNMYNRIITTCYDRYGNRQDDVFVYEYNHNFGDDEERLIVSGDWKNPKDTIQLRYFDDPDYDDEDDYVEED